MKLKRSLSSVFSQSLGELELAIMAILWRAPDQDSKGIAMALEGDNAPSLSTVQSTLERLCKKGLAARSKQGHAYRYRPAVTRSQLLGRLMSQVIRLLHDGKTDTILSSFVNVAADLDQNALDELQQLIEKKRRVKESEDER